MFGAWCAAWPIIRSSADPFGEIYNFFSWSRVFCRFRHWATSLQEQAVDMSTEVASTSAHGSAAVEKKQKKRKRTEDAAGEHPAAAVAGDDDARKAERKEEKRLKKRAKKDAEAPAADVSGKEAESKAERKARKAERRAAKETTATTEHSSNGIEKPVVEIREQETAVIAEGDSSRTESKAEKKARKAAKRAEKEARSSNETAVPAEKPKLVSSAAALISGYQQSAKLAALSDSKVKEYLEAKMIHVETPDSTEFRPIMEFDQLPSVVGTQSKLFKGFKEPTPVQSAAWPYLLNGQDVIGVAQTGSGKTLAFGLPCVRYVQANLSGKASKIMAVVLSPTRELAQQIHEQYQKLAEGTSVRMACLVGGMPKDDQRPLLKKAHVVIATPGRLQDFIEEGAADLGQVGFLVLDEADRMLDTGFEQAIRKIIAPMPKAKQTLMFTATWPPSVRELASSFMRKAVKITIGDNTTGELRANTRIKQEVEVIDPRGKEQRLMQLLKEHQSGRNKDDRILVFCLYKKEAVRVERLIASRGFRVAAIHGDMSQQQRNASFESFRSGKVPVLVATDVAARGLDIPAVKVVINVTFPLTVEDYVHRIGR